MGTEVAVSFSSLRAQLESERTTLYKIDANIKKIVQNPGRYSDRFKNPNTEYGRGNTRPGGRNSFPDSGNLFRNDDVFGTKKGDTKTVFSRLSARAAESEGEEEALGAGGKRARMSSAVSRELPSRAEVLRAQGGDEQARTRNRRIFGSLLGTLQKFKQEEISLQTKEDKRAQVEKKIEEQARQQKEKEIIERKTLFAEREHKKATIRALEAKMARLEEFEHWEASQRSLGNFILTKTKPHMYWLPKKMSENAQEKLSTSRSYHEKCMMRKRQELQEELQRIEQRCLRPRAPGGANENEPAAGAPQPQGRPRSPLGAEDSSKKRDKFAMDEDDREDSDNDEHHDKRAADDTAPTNDEDSKMDTSDTQQPQTDEVAEPPQPAPEPEPEPEPPAPGTEDSAPEPASDLP